MIIQELRDLVRLLGKLKVDDVLGPDAEAEHHFRVEHDGLKPEEVLKKPDHVEDDLDALGLGTQPKESESWEVAQQKLQAVETVIQHLIAEQQI